MILYLLTRNPDDVGFDEYVAKLIRAKSESEARQIANQQCADEGAIWTDPEKVGAEIIVPEGSSAVILDSFNAG